MILAHKQKAKGKKQFLFHALLLFSIILLDQLSKYWIAKHFILGETYPLLPFLALHYTYNEGIAFSLFSSSPTFFLILSSSLILIALSYLWYKTETKQKLARLGYNFIVAGALGNLIDRIRLGHVIDFISFYVTDLFHFAIFNVADSFITIGAIIIILEEILLFLNKRKYLTNQE